MKQVEKQKRRIIIVLSIIVIFMAIGFAAFATNLNINGIASISSSWNVQITNIRGVNDKNVTNNQAYEVENTSITNNNLTANFHTGLKNPGDKRIYEIEVTNFGSIDAWVTTSFINNSSSAIIFTYDGISDTSVLANDGTYNNANLSKREPFDLLHGTNNKKYLYITVEYDPNIENQPENLEASIIFNLEAVQKDSSTIVNSDKNLSVSLKYLNSPKNNDGYDTNETVNYSVTVKNISNEYIYDLTADLSPSGNQKTVGDLAPGQSYTFTDIYDVSEYDILEGEFTIEVLMDGTNDSGDSIDTTIQSIQQTTAPRPEITIEIEPTNSPQNQNGYVLFEEIQYKATATNTGNITLTNIVLTDTLSNEELFNDILYPGSSYELDGGYTVAENDILAGSVLLEATAEAQTASQDIPEITAEQTLEVLTEEPRNDLLVNIRPISNPANGNYYTVGEIVNLEITITNNGNLTITDATLTMEIPSFNQPIESIEPGVTFSYAKNYSIGENDVSQGYASFTANVRASSPHPDEPSITKFKTTQIQTG